LKNATSDNERNIMPPQRMNETLCFNGEFHFDISKLVDLVWHVYL
jgi:hypothetical protein